MRKNQDEKTTPGDILIVDDETANLKLLKELLSREGYQVRPSDRPQLAIDSALAQPPALILLDVRMPDMDGFEVCKRLKQDERTRDIPVIFVSALQDAQSRVHGLGTGGVDFISKPFQEEEVLARVRTHLELRNMQLNLEEMVAKCTAEFVGSEAKYRGLVENALVGVFSSTLDGRFIFVNEALARMFDFESPEQMIAQRSLEHWSDQKDRERMLAELQQHGRVTNFEAETITHTDRHIYVLFSAKQVGNDIIGMVMDITDRKQAETKLQKAYTAIEQLQMKLQAETAYLQEEIKLEYDFESIIGNSSAIQHVLFKVEQVAGTDATVLVLGETGTGKELIARAIHNRSLRKKHPLVKVNCAALPSNLIESELFGHEPGAFTGAQTRQIGRFEVADGTSIFLDEIGDLPLELQSKLLQVLQDGEFERLGSPRTIKVDVRVIAATNRDLEAQVRKGEFREDLFYRLNVFPLTVPPLRERVEDIPLLAEYFMGKASRRLGKSINILPTSVVNSLKNHPWPGNVRELENVIERAVINSSGPKLRLAEELVSLQRDLPTPLKPMKTIEFDHIVRILEHADWKISGKNGAAEILGLKRGTLRARMQKLGIRKP
jgi:chemotaxis protein methyltransferase CheR